MRVGTLDLSVIHDGAGSEPRDLLSRPGFDGDPWHAHGDLLDGCSQLPLSVGGYLLRTGERTMLFDTGVGMIDNGKYRGGQFLETLKRYGVEPEEVTDVVFTHLHFDHVGWATRKGEVVFNRATYRVHQRDWEHFVTGPQAESGAVRKLGPLTERLETFASDTTLAPGVDTRHMPGHTPGSTMFVISHSGRRAALIGDIAHTPIELIEPGWHFAHDNDVAEASAARDDVAAEFTDTDTDIFGAHFPGLAPIRLETIDGKRHWTPSPRRD